MDGIKPDSGLAIRRPQHNLRKFMKMRRVFVAMPFQSPHSEELWKTIQFVAASNDYEATRADESSQSRLVISVIYEEIKKARIVIVDLTDLNPNVIYELGLAHANCEAVLLTCKAGQKLPFDITGFHCIFFDVSTVAGRRKFNTDLWTAMEAAQEIDRPQSLEASCLERSRSLMISPRCCLAQMN
jgi:hypothetical protein